MVNIDTVYQRVLALANKEQRGYITPQEFNLMANQAQEDLFEQYFYELNLQEKGEAEVELGSFGDMVDLIKNKLHYFTTLGLMIYQNGSWQIPPNTYRTGRIYYNDREPKIGDATDMYNLQYANAKDGGIIKLAYGGEPTHEMDYRPGGFIPVGAQERADDVPARLSKNEFVMTADAVRAAGGGSVDVGAQRMYNLMNQLEGVA